jgi:hypothetical protein
MAAVKNVLAVKHLTPVGGGRQCHVFVHPDDPGLIVKVVTADYVRKRSREGNYYNRWHKNYIRKHHNHVRVGPYLGFLRELREHLAVQASGEPLPRHMQALVGFAETDLGLGLVSRAVRGKDGALAPNLLTLLREDRFDTTARRHLEQFFDWLLASPVVTCDLNMGNLVYGNDPDVGDLFVMIDGIGEKNWLPFSSISRRMNRMSKLRRIGRLQAKIEAFERQRGGGAHTATAGGLARAADPLR